MIVPQWPLLVSRTLADFPGRAELPMSLLGCSGLARRAATEVAQMISIITIAASNGSNEMRMNHTRVPV